MGVGHVAHVNENAFAVGLIALKKLNKCSGLRRIEAGRNGYVEVVVAETVAQTRMIGKHRLLIHIFISALLNVHGGTLSQAELCVNKNEITFQIQIISH